MKQIKVEGALPGERIEFGRFAGPGSVPEIVRMRKINYAEPVYYVTLVGIDTEILVPSFGCLNSYTRFTNLVGKKHDHVYYDKCPDWREKLAHAMETMTIEQPPGDGDKNK